VDQAARDLFSERGLAEFTSHPVGHGLGLAKEPPVLAQGSGDVLRVGDCVTVEPGVYIPGFGGVRIEDILLIRDEAVECLSRAPRDLSFAVID
jgi:Xaa-Pro aminopeptidase